MLNTYDVERNFAWMRTVTLEEAQNCKKRMSLWASSDKNPRGGSWDERVYEPIKEKKISREPILEMALEKAQDSNERDRNDKKNSESSWDEWVYEPSINIEWEMLERRKPGLVMALTKLCAQHMWRVPSYFSCCPEEIGEDPLETYFQNLKVGAVFAYNDVYPKSTVVEFVKTKNNLSILVMCEKEDLKPWSIAEITFENGYYVHSSLGSYFEKDGADKVFCIEQGLEWAGGDTFDDFC